MNRIAVALVALVALAASARVAQADPCPPNGERCPYVITTDGNGNVIDPRAVSPGSTTPVKVGGQVYAASTPIAIIPAASCAHGCYLQDISACGFNVDYTGGTPTTSSEWVPAQSWWKPPQGTTTWAVSVLPSCSGIIVGSYTP